MTGRPPRGNGRGGIFIKEGVGLERLADEIIEWGGDPMEPPNLN